tara:strand:- start:36 stop:317 length:282 start_codon:yes stop_codon:yes gene_type:complete
MSELQTQIDELKRDVDELDISFNHHNDDINQLSFKVDDVEDSIEMVSTNSQNLKSFIQGLVDLLGYHMNKEEMSPEDFVKCVRKFCDERRFYV